MAEAAVSMAGQHLLPKFLEAANMLKDLPNEVADFTDELEKFQAFINGADKVAEAEEDGNRRDRIKKRVMRLREVSFRMEDIIDEYYMICEEKQPDDLGCAALPCEAVEFIKTLIHRIQIAYKIQEVKSIVHKERDGFKSVFSLEERPNNSRGNQHVTWHRYRMDPLYTEEDKVVGFDGPKDQLKDWLIKGKPELTVISVVGMGGQGKTTLAKTVFDSKEVFRSFDCRAWVTVSQSYTVEGVLGNMMRKFDLNVSTRDQESLIDEVRDYLRHKRNLVQVCSFSIDGKPKRCRVHDLLREMILRKMKDTGFGLYIGERNQSISSEIVRHLVIAAGSEDLFGRIEGSYVRSIQIIMGKKLSKHLVRSIPTKCMSLKVLHFESTLSTYVPKNLGNLIYLKYLSFWGMATIPESIGKLQNLETLDARDSTVIFMPKEISKLRKLRHLLVGGFISLVKVKDSLGDMASLEHLHTLRIDDNGVMIRELAKLNKLRDLRLDYLRKEHGCILGSSINVMQFLEKLHINARDPKEVIDLQTVSPKSTLRKLLLSGKLEKFPNWIPELRNLVKLTLEGSTGDSGQHICLYGEQKRWIIQ
ncbi:hypothetical protein Fmac_027129 [Flemingia macrophylla]|uniref:Uncharacterized protein n=1 Tax=Flemingia macrophylla TaxID=520843 RepID=A0ABD1LGT5_9FABA